VFDDMVEFGGADSLPYFQHFLPHAITYITDDDPAVRQAAVYGAGVFAQVGGDQIASGIPDILNRLKHVITQPNSRDEAYVMATDNAIGAVAKIIRYQSKVVDISQILPVWLSWLPVKDDDVEAHVTYGQLLYFIETYVLHSYYTNCTLDTTRLSLDQTINTCHIFLPSLAKFWTRIWYLRNNRRRLYKS
jgi:hypothetical protein